MHQLDQYTEHLIRHQQAAARTRLAHRHLVREALAARRLPLYRIALVSLGRRLEIWGTQLQRRYADLPHPPVLLANE